MRDTQRSIPGRIPLYLTPEHECAYLPPRPAQTLFIDPGLEPDEYVYDHLLQAGFRRSGDHVYRPDCPGCHACVPVRIPVAGFQPKRNQRRCWNRIGEQVEVIGKTAGFDPEHYRIYQTYTATRHPEGGMADADETRYLEFLTTRWCETLFVEFRLRGRLMAVAVTDRLPHALSAVYTFFDPELSSHSPGTFAILWQLELARGLKLPHLYLGYWIGDSDKMHYKANFRPLEAWNGQSWKRFDTGASILV